MRQYLLLRIAQLIPVLFLASVAIWALMYLLPGDPVFAMLGPNATPEQVTAVRAQLGFDQPVPGPVPGLARARPARELWRLVPDGLPVPELIGSRAIATVQLGTMAFVLSMVVGVTLGVVAAARPTSWAARLVGTYNSLTLALPSFWLGLLLILLFGVWLKVLPPASAFIPIWVDPLGTLRMSLLPVVTLAATPRASWPASSVRRCSTCSARTTCAPRGPRAWPSKRSSGATPCGTRCCRR